MSSRANKRRRRACIDSPARHGRMGTGSQAKQLHGRDPLNSYIPTEVDTNWTQARPEDACIAYGPRWTDPAWALPDTEIPYAVLAGVRVNNNSRCTDARPASETPRPSSNRVQKEHRPVRHASDQMNRLSYGDLLQHGIMQERK